MNGHKKSHSLPQLPYALWRFLTFEWVLEYYPNGGFAIFIRSGILSTGLFLGAMGARIALDTTLPFDEQLLKHMHWLGAIFAGIYTALYARFASQWQYLATLYNSIKSAEARGSDSAVVAQMKVGFIEDALELHLARKQLFATVALAWGMDKQVEQEFCEHVPDGRPKLVNLLHSLGALKERIAAHQCKCVEVSPKPTSQ